MSNESSKNSILIGLLSGALVVSLAAVGFLYMQNKDSQQNLMVASQQVQPIPSTIVIAEKETAKLENITGKYMSKGDDDVTLNIVDLNNGTIKFSIDTVSNYPDNIGGRCTGSIEESIAQIEGNRATFKDGAPSDVGECQLTIEFKGQVVEVSENGCGVYHGANCSFNSVNTKI